MKSFSAYCIFLLQASEEAGAERVNMPVDPGREVQFYKEVQSSAVLTNRGKDFVLFPVHKYTAVCMELLT